MRAVRWVTLALLALAMAAFGRYFLERHESAALRAEIALLEHENRQVAELRAKHDRLLASKVADAELEQLRNDRAALSRLRAAVDKLEESAEGKLRAMQDPVVRPIPARILNLGVGRGGDLLLNGAASDYGALRQLLTECARRSERLDVRFHIRADETPMDQVRTTIEWIAQQGKELGLPLSFRFERSGQAQLTR